MLRFGSCGPRNAVVSSVMAFAESAWLRADERLSSPDAALAVD
jgi:hypothetical protein